MKRAYLVLGAESSCTRFITKCLIKAGCSGTTLDWETHEPHPNGHAQKIVFTDPTENCIVWRRSFPHAWV